MPLRQVYISVQEYINKHVVMYLFIYAPSAKCWKSCEILYAPKDPIPLQGTHLFTYVHACAYVLAKYIKSVYTNNFHIFYLCTLQHNCLLVRPFYFHRAAPLSPQSFVLQNFFIIYRQNKHLPKFRLFGVQQYNLVRLFV